MNDVNYDSKNHGFEWPAIASDAVQALATHWSTLAVGGQAPARERFTPLDLPPRAWKNLFLLDFFPETGEFRVRVHGTYFADAAGIDLTGRRLNDAEIPGCTRTAMYPLLPRIVASGRPQYYKGPTLFRFPDWIRGIEQALCPLADETGRIAAIIGAGEYAPIAHSAESGQRTAF